MSETLLRVAVACFCAAALVGCGGGSSREMSDAERDKLAKAQIDRLFANLKPTTPLPSGDMLGLLPKAPDGWQGMDPFSKADKIGEARYSEAGCEYASKDFTKTASIRIRDTAGYPYSWVTFEDELSQESGTDEKRGLYVKVTEIDGYWARELGYKKPKSCAIASMVGRFGIRIEAFGLDAEEAKAIFWKALDLEAMKKVSGL